jgi:divalent metal cation (Fe/Co/Zn/Cd) transporter
MFPAYRAQNQRALNQVFCEPPLSVDESLSVKEAHDLTDHLENVLRDELPNANLTIRIEPKKPN